MNNLPGYDAWKTMSPDEERDRNEEPVGREYEDEPEDEEPGEPLDPMRGVDFPFADNH